MIGIDIARIKRWFLKTYTQYSGTSYSVVVTDINQTNIDHKGGEDMDFELTVYNADNEVVVSVSDGVYNRMLYGGWNAHSTLGPQAPATLQEAVNDGEETPDLPGSENTGSVEPGNGG